MTPRPVARAAKARLWPCLLLLLALLSPSLSAAQVLEFSAYYQARTNGMRGEAERHLQRLEGGDWRLNTSLEARVVGIKVGELEQFSEFKLTPQGIVPKRYHYQLSGISSDLETVKFDWQSGVAESQVDAEHWRLELLPGVLDQLSYQLALAQAVQAADAEEYEFKLVDGDEIETQRFRNLGHEVLDTPLGRLNTVKMQRVRAPSSVRQTRLWFAPDWNYLLVKIEQISGSGSRTDLELRQAIVNGEPVTPLP